MTQALSTFTFRALIEALKHLDPKQTALLRGRHGIGKSAIAYQAAEFWGLSRVIERRISQLSEGDMIGLPDRGAVKSFDGKEWHVTSFLPTDWFLEAMHYPCLIFLDEINRGTPETMQACFQFVEKGELNGRKIHPGSRIIAAVNFSREYQVTHMDPAFLDRFWTADVEPDKEDWLTWARKDNRIHETVIDFVTQCNTDHFEIMPEKAAKMPPTEITPSRRSWERLNNNITKELNNKKLIDHPGDGVLYNIARGYIGPDAARAFVSFAKTAEANISPEDVLNRFSENSKKIKKLKPETIVSLVDKIKHYVESKNVKFTQEQAENLSKFAKAIPAEISLLIWSLATADINNAKLVHASLGKHIFDIVSSEQRTQKQNMDSSKLASPPAAAAAPTTKK